MYQNYVDVVKEKNTQKKENKMDQINEEKAINEIMLSELEQIEKIEKSN